MDGSKVACQVVGCRQPVVMSTELELDWLGRLAVDLCSFHSSEVVALVNVAMEALLESGSEELHEFDGGREVA